MHPLEEPVGSPETEDAEDSVGGSGLGGHFALLCSLAAAVLLNFVVGWRRRRGEDKESSSVGSYRIRGLKRCILYPGQISTAVYSMFTVGSSVRNVNLVNLQGTLSKFVRCLDLNSQGAVYQSNCKGLISRLISRELQGR